MKILGNAEDFYRLRTVTVDEPDAPDLDWRDDILYRAHPLELVGEERVIRVEAVSVDDDEDVTVLAALSGAEEAAEWLARAGEDLATMSKSAFEEAYFPDDVA